MNNTKQEFIGILYINKSKDGKTTYLRGTVNGVDVVAFKNKNSESYGILPDTRKEESAPKKSYGAKKSYPAAKPTSSEDLF